MTTLANEHGKIISKPSTTKKRTEKRSEEKKKHHSHNQSQCKRRKRTHAQYINISIGNITTPSSTYKCGCDSTYFLISFRLLMLMLLLSFLLLLLFYHCFCCFTSRLCALFVILYCLSSSISYLERFYGE